MDTSPVPETASNNQFASPQQLRVSSTNAGAAPEHSSPSDEDVYSSYISILSSVHDGYDNLIAKAQANAQWYQEKSYEANRVAQQLRGTPKSVNVPSAPSEYTVKNELENASRKAEELQRIEGELTQLQSDLQKKQQEIDSRNAWLTGGAVVYVIGVVIVGAASNNILAGLLWPLVVAAVVIGFWILSLFGGGS